MGEFGTVDLTVYPSAHCHMALARHARTQTDIGKNSMVLRIRGYGDQTENVMGELLRALQDATASDAFDPAYVSPPQSSRRGASSRAENDVP